MRIQRGRVKPENPDRLIVLSKLLNMDKKSQRHPSHSTALAFHCVHCVHEEGESGLRGKKDEGRRAEKLNAKLLGLWEGISP